MPVSFLIKLQVCNFIKKETLAQVSPCEFCIISKNTFSYRTTPVAASVNIYQWRGKGLTERFLKTSFWTTSQLPQLKGTLMHI